MDKENERIYNPKSNRSKKNNENMDLTDREEGVHMSPKERNPIEERKKRIEAQQRSVIEERRNDLSREEIFAKYS